MTANTDNLTPEAAAGLAAGTVDAAQVGENFSGDFSLLGMFWSSDLVVQIVMIILILWSVWSWAIIYDKRRSLKKLNQRADRFEEAFWSGESLDRLYQRVKKSPEDPMLKTFSAGMEEWQTSVSTGLPTKDSLQMSLRQRIERAMSVRIGKEIHRIERGMTFLASIGATAPFLGLFGTVWGIINSFSAIAVSKNISLVVVAPGIAEALLTTAFGLIAAIPAVMAYNILSQSINRYVDRLDNFAVEFASILSRHMDRQDLNLPPDAKAQKDTAVNANNSAMAAE